MCRGGGTGSGKIPIIYQHFYAFPKPNLLSIQCLFYLSLHGKLNEKQLVSDTLTKAIAVVSYPIWLFCFVFHICFFYAEMPRGWCMMGHWMCVPLVKRSGNAPTSNGWLAFACLYHLSSSDIVANKRKFKRKKEDANLHPSLCWQFLYCVLFL